VLPLACGRATRLVRFLSASDKEYEATIVFGVTTDTLDVTGTETSRSGRTPSRDALVDAIVSLTGDYLQMPPAYSAKKIGGRRAYVLARRHEPVTLTAAPVRAPRVDLLEFGDDRCRVSLTCSAGFYVRSFVRDLGERCGTGACLEALRRTRSGDFSLDEAVPLEALERRAGSDEGGPVNLETLLIPMEKLLPALPAVTVTTEGLARVSHGQDVRSMDLVDSMPPGAAEWVRLLDAGGALVGLGIHRTAPGLLHPEVVLI
jgi:tRNA pseudouridine55 synthase